MNLLNSFSFELPTQIEYGIGAVQKLTEALLTLNAANVLVVTDKGLEATGLLSGIASRLEKHGL
jgi:alcohol dehydrogenase class IV